MVRAFYKGKEIWDVDHVRDGVFTFRYVGTEKFDITTGDLIELVDDSQSEES